MAVQTYEIKISIVNQFLEIVWDTLPLILIAPLFFADKIEFGAIAQGAMSC